MGHRDGVGVVHDHLRLVCAGDGVVGQGVLPLLGAGDLHREGLSLVAERIVPADLDAARGGFLRAVQIAQREGVPAAQVHQFQYAQVQAGQKRLDPLGDGVIHPGAGGAGDGIGHIVVGVGVAFFRAGHGGGEPCCAPIGDAVGFKILIETACLAWIIIRPTVETNVRGVADGDAVLAGVVPNGSVPRLHHRARVGVVFPPTDPRRQPRHGHSGHHKPHAYPQAAGLLFLHRRRCGGGGERVQHLLHGLVTVTRVRGAQFQNDGGQRGRAVVGRGQGTAGQPLALGVVAVLGGEFGRVGGQKRSAPVVGQLVKHKAEGVQIAAGVGLTGQLLGRGISRGTRGRERSVRRGGVLRHAEIPEVEVPGGAAQNVGGLDIPVADAVFVADAQGVADIQRDLAGVGAGLLRRVGQMVHPEGRERLQQIHADEQVKRAVVGLFHSVELVDVDDVRAFEVYKKFDLTRFFRLDAGIVFVEGDALLLGLAVGGSGKLHPHDLDGLAAFNAGDRASFGAGVHRAARPAAERRVDLDIGPFLGDEGENRGHWDHSFVNSFKSKYQYLSYPAKPGVSANACTGCVFS